MVTNTSRCDHNHSANGHLCRGFVPPVLYLRKYFLIHLEPQFAMNGGESSRRFHNSGRGKVRSIDCYGLKCITIVVKFTGFFACEISSGKVVIF